jgi:hypothetical protein
MEGEPATANRSRDEATLPRDGVTAMATVTALLVSRAGEPYL